MRLYYVCTNVDCTHRWTEKTWWMIELRYNKPMAIYNLIPVNLAITDLI